MMKVFLGIDTSCYTTSLAVLDEAGRLIADQRKLLSVKNGARGLAQSEMVFQHTRNLPGLLEQALDGLEQPLKLAAVGVSAFPRALPDSYMPAFVAGLGYAKVIAAVQNVALWQISHQENHILAGIWSAGGPAADRFLAVQASGGTTEMLLVAKKSGGYHITLLGGSRDLKAGQFIDRIGVAMSLPFPAGRHLELLARNHHAAAAAVPVAVDGLLASFSGPASHAARLLEQGAAPHAVAAGVECCIAATVSRLIQAAIRETGIRDVLLIGGVMSNEFIRSTIVQSMALFSDQVKVYLPEPAYSPDNAVGAAYYPYHTIHTPGI